MADNPTPPKPKPKPKRKIKRPSKPIAPEDKPLDDREKVFVDEFLIRNQAMQAALAAGYSVSVAKGNAYLWASNSEYKPHVYKAIQKAREERAERMQVTADKVLEHWWKIATADPNELTQHRRYCCRHCFGHDHAFQWIDEDEYHDALRRAEKDDAAITPNDLGGYDFDRELPPHPKCPRCFGDGDAAVFIADTRNLSDAGKLLYAGVEVTNQGLKIKMHDQAKARENVARHLGMFKDGLNLGVDPESPLAELLAAVTGNTLKPGANYPIDDEDEE